MKMKPTKIKRHSRREKPVVEPVPVVAPSAETFTQQDFAGANVETEKPKRSYTRRKSSGGDLSGVSFGKLLEFAGETIGKLSGLVTKQDAPLNPAEKEMLHVVGDTCGKFLIDEEMLDEVAPKYAKYAVVGVLALIAGVRAIDYFTRPRLNAGVKPSIAYDISPEASEPLGEYQG